MNQCIQKIAGIHQAVLVDVDRNAGHVSFHKMKWVAYQWTHGLAVLGSYDSRCTV